MTIQNLYPKARPDVIYNVINGRNELPINSTFSRSSVGTYTASNGEVKTAAADEPRFEYDQDTLEYKGLLLEDAGQNDASYSENPKQWNLNETLSTSSVDLNYTIDPSGSSNATRFRAKINPGEEANSAAFALYTLEPIGGSYPAGTPYAISLWMKTNDGTSPVIYFQEASGSNPPGTRPTISPEWRRYTIYGQTITDAIRWYLGVRGGQTGSLAAQDVDISIWGLQLERVNKGASSSSYIPTPANTAVTREPDQLSLFGSNRFDNGFSLLLDSETTTEDFIYKIKASGTEIASLSNDGGTLDWEINGKSASINGEYPQVGFTLGRSRTISSFGPADQGDVANFLYTTGVSFPTTAEPAAGANEIEFGVPQTLKALYVWQGQLDQTNAVSLIKGQYNVVPNKPIAADAYSFVYNTDPASEGRRDATLQFLIPTVAMTVDWGDGNSNTYEKGVTATHVYPYPGEYRIQVVADDGFDQPRLATNNDNITRVDQWAPQYRVGATGPGFTDDDMLRIVVSQSTLNYIPEFKYTNLTTLYQAFSNCGSLNDSATYWPWMPVELPECTTLSGAFQNLMRYNNFQGFRRLPQLQTSDKLTDLTGVYGGTFTESFFLPDQTATDLPWTNSVNVTSFENALSYYRGTSMGAFSMDSAQNLKSCFSNAVNLTTTPLFNTSKVTNFDTCFNNCRALTSVFMDFTAATTAADCFRDCVSLVNPPAVKLPNIKTPGSMYRGCTSLSNITGWQAPKAISYADTFRETKITICPAFDSPEVSSWYRAFVDCSELVEFASHDMSLARNCESMFSNCQKLTSIPLDGSFKFPALTNFRSALNTTAITDFPANAFDSTGTLNTLAFNASFNATKLNKTAIENILVSLETNVNANSANEGVQLGIKGGNVAPRYTGSSGTTLNWTAAAEAAFQTLLAKGWTIEYQKYAGQSETLPSRFYVMHGDAAVHFVESDGAVESGQLEQESFEHERDAVKRVLELDRDYFPRWKVDGDYLPGDRVKFFGSVYRSLKTNNAAEFVSRMQACVEAPTPATSQGTRWEEVYDPIALEEE